MTKGKAGAALVSGSGSSSGSEGASSTVSRAEMVKASADVRFDFEAAYNALMLSYRNDACEEFVVRSYGEYNDECELPKRGRVTAYPRLTSAQKIQFDIRQLQHIAAKSGDIHIKRKIEATLLDLHNIQGTVSSQKAITVRAKEGRSINRLLLLVEDKLDPFYTHKEGIDYGKQSVSLIGTDQNDFIVLDGILLEYTRKNMISLLLSSSIWHDVSSGQAFVSHSDDTLIYSAFHSLGKVSFTYFEGIVNVYVAYYGLVYSQ